MTTSKKPLEAPPVAPSMTTPPLSATHEREVAYPHSPTIPSPKRLSSVVFGDEDVSAEIPRAPELPSAWLDRLLQLATTLPVRDGEVEVVGVVLDVTAELLDGAAVGVCFVDADNTQRIVRRADRGSHSVDPTRLFPGYSHEVVLELPELAGSTLHAASDDPDILSATSPAARLLARIANVLRSGLAHARVYAKALKSDGTVHDLESQMVQAEKLASLGQIAAGLVHELNNPLTSIVAYTDYLTKRWMVKRDADATGATSDELERLRRIGESAHRLLRFTRDLVSYARPSSETPVPVVLHGVIDQALVFCDHVLTETGTKVERGFGDGISPVRGIPEQLTQVFVNLVTNACHAMAAGGGSVSISTELTEGDDFVRIVVKDSGTGISPANIQRIFLPFFTTKASGRGTGLGLSIVKNIIESHGGSITVESELSIGTSFVICLPAAVR